MTGADGPDRGQPLRDGTDRGQTLPDFAVGIAFFLITVTFVFVFVPQMVLPYEGQEQPVVTDRAAGDLSHYLTEGNGSAELNETRTKGFFAQSEDVAREQLGVDPWYSLNVTLRDAPSHGRNSNVYCSDSGDDWIVVNDSCDESDRFAMGDPFPEDDRSVSTVRRTFFVDDRNVVLEVRVW